MPIMIVITAWNDKNILVNVNNILTVEKSYHEGQPCATISAMDGSTIHCKETVGEIQKKIEHKIAVFAPAK